jgi:hypothetical protein
MLRLRRAALRRPRPLAARCAALLGLAASLAVAAAAEPPFSQAVPRTEFTAAGLGKLTAEELARLDALVGAYQSGALASARREAAAAAARAAAAEARAAETAARAQAASPPAAASADKPDTSLLARAKVLLMPGTKIEYATVESRIAGDFRGWEGRTVFTLENGQRWQVQGGDPYISPPVRSPAVKIVPGAMGSFFLTVEGVRPRARVALVGTP